MPLPGYGMLIGRIVGSRPQSGGHPHWLLMVQPAAKGHPPYRVAVNLASTEPGSPPEVEYQIIDIDAAGTPQLKALAARLKALGPTSAFIPAPTAPALDFVRGQLLDPTDFSVNDASDPLTSAFENALAEAASADEQQNAYLAVFGTGYPVNAATGHEPSTGFEGVDNIHMNQGAYFKTGAGAHFRENGANQDGGLIFLLPSGPKAFFVKFQSQTVQTDAQGNPLQTGIDQIDQRAQRVTALLRQHPGLTAAIATATTQAAQPLPGESSTGFVFADPDPDDSTGQFIPATDGQTFTSPFVVQYAKGQTRGPVPVPRGYPRMDLTGVTGANPAGYSQSGAGDQVIQFDVVGDSGAVTQAKLVGEQSVADMMTTNAIAQPASFLFHVGDVVYYYGQQEYFYGQFANVFKNYPAPIFAIPGNHDGIPPDASSVSLAAFQQAFCSPTPGRWEGFGGILRSTMTQPGVYFTLDAPLVSIVGLYSNCGESLGWLDPQQLNFLHSEFERLATARSNDGRVVILAIHHFPRWFGGSTTDPTSQAIDAICQSTNCWPDAVFCGHAHLYERIIRPVAGRSIPYFVVGAGGYAVTPMEEVGKAYVAANPQTCTKLFEEGYLRVSISKPAAGAGSIAFKYYGTKHPAGTVADSCSLDLATHQVTIG